MEPRPIHAAGLITGLATGFSIREERTGQLLHIRPVEGVVLHLVPFKVSKLLGGGCESRHVTTNGDGAQLYSRHAKPELSQHTLREKAVSLLT